MVRSILEESIDQLTIDERMELLAKIWESLNPAGQPFAMPDWHREELTKRLERSKSDPGDGISLEQLRRELRQARA